MAAAARACRARRARARARASRVADAHPSMPHRVLGVAANASPTVIKEAFRRLALAHHPDRGGCPRHFQRIMDSYESMMQRPAGATRPHPGGSHEAGFGQHEHGGWQRAREAEAEAERREFDRMRREWRRQHEEDMRETPESEDRKWFYLRLVCAWVGLGAVVKLAAMQLAFVARERALAAPSASLADPSSAPLLAPIAVEHQRRRAPVATSPPRQ